jgi:uncharacterized protein YeeX (DUF496 family)
MINAIRFRTQENLVVLQVRSTVSPSYSSYTKDEVWRDAKVEDLLEVAAFCKSDFESRLDNLIFQIDGLQKDFGMLARNVQGEDK